MKKTWLQNSDNHLEGQLVGVGAATKKKKKKKLKYIWEKRPDSRNKARRWSLLF